ncbi:MAG: hypothetical protein ACOX6P_06140 [Candidatus Merdivicinus sp.]
MVNFLETGDGLYQVFIMETGRVQKMKRILSRLLPPGIQILPFSKAPPQAPLLLIIPECGRIPENFSIPSSATIIVSSEEQHQLLALAGTSARVITCGYGYKDTVTVSSSQDDCVVVSLLRSFQGKENVVEPLDLPLHARPSDDAYPLLAGAATMLYFQLADPQNLKISSYNLSCSAHNTKANANKFKSIKNIKECKNYV